MDFRNVSLRSSLESLRTSELAFRYLQVKHTHRDVVPIDLDSFYGACQKALSAYKYAKRIRDFVYTLNTRDSNKESLIQNRVDDETGPRYNLLMARLG